MNKIIYIVNFARGGFYSIDKEIKGDIYLKVYQNQKEKEVQKQIDYILSILGRI
jgi:hypothetical protein